MSEMIDSEEKMSPQMWEMMLDYKLMLIVDDEFEKRSDQLEIIGFQSEDEDLCLKRSLLPNFIFLGEDEVITCRKQFKRPKPTPGYWRVRQELFEYMLDMAECEDHH